MCIRDRGQGPLYPLESLELRVLTNEALALKSHEYLWLEWHSRPSPKLRNVENFFWRGRSTLSFYAALSVHLTIHFLAHSALQACPSSRPDLLALMMDKLAE